MPNPIAEVEREFTDMAGLLNIRVIGSLDGSHFQRAGGRHLFQSRGL